MSARTWTVAGLVVGAAGLVAQKVAGVAMPAVPPGLVLMVGSAILIVATRRRWPVVVGALAAVAEVAAVLSGFGKLTDFAEAGVAAASWVRLVGVLLAVGAGAVATIAAYRREPVTT
ncbi:hypothetical protein [Actinophytocola glycyrrhizae]|uniref:Secreted protein with PEP-CTERM sorting signal n=1 Tax=Actinophytocola glycyrrhizae TaxID=2044873 RepID=A0ABV9S0M3_9PSEU